MINRRQFLLRGLLATAGVTVIPPSQMWPFRKIFLPPVTPMSVREALEMVFPLQLEWDDAAGLFVINGGQLAAMHKMITEQLSRRNA
jgi:hypothetical protein